MGKSKFVYIFFFNAQQIHLTWDEFSSYMQYDNFAPRGNIYSIADTRLDQFGGALEFINFILEKHSSNTFLYPNDLDLITSSNGIADKMYDEGSIVQITLNAHERNPQAREACIRHYNNEYKCEICGFRFIDRYGENGRYIIQVHHLNPVAEKRGEYLLDPKMDLIPVCPNCHAFIHSRKVPYSIQEVKELLSNLMNSK